MKRFVVYCLVAIALTTSSVTPVLACDQPQWGPVARFPEPTSNGNVRQQVPIASSPVLAINKDGRLEVFAIGTDGELWHSVQTDDRQGWTDLESLHRPLKRMFKASPRDRTLVAAFDRVGRMTVFLVSEGEIWTIRQLVAGGAWGTWGQFGRSAKGTPRKLWLVANQDGRLELFVEHDATLNHVWQFNPDTWSDFVEFGWPQSAYDELAIARDRNGRIVLGAVNVQSAFVRRQTDPNSGWQPWTAISSPSGDSLGPLVAIAPNQDGRLEMLVEQQFRDEHQPTSGIYSVSYAHTWQSDRTQWSGSWETFGAPYPYLQWKAIDATILPNLNGCLAVSALSDNRTTVVSRLTPLYQKKASSTWNPWIHGRETSWSAAVESYLAVARRSDSYLELFMRGADGSWLHASQLRNQIIVGGH